MRHLPITLLLAGAVVVVGAFVPALGADEDDRYEQDNQTSVSQSSRTETGARTAQAPDDDVDDDIFDDDDQDDGDGNGNATDTAEETDPPEVTAAPQARVLGAPRTPRTPRTPRSAKDDPVAVADTSSRNDDGLPRTGADLMRYSLTAFALIGIGLVMMAVRTRERSVIDAHAPWGDEPLIGW